MWWMLLPVCLHVSSWVVFITSFEDDNFCFVFSIFISLLFSFQYSSSSRLVDVNFISNPLKLNSQFLFFFIIFFEGKILSIIAAGMKALENEENICLLETTE